MPDNPAEGGIPPKVSQIKPVSPIAPVPGGAPAPQRTVVLKRPPVLRKVGESPATPPAAPAQTSAPTENATQMAGATAVATGIEISHEQAAKRMTSRINLASATAQIPAVTVNADDREAPTVKLRPVPPPATPAPAASSAAAQGELPPIDPKSPVMPSKSKTSRITMDAAYAAQPSIPPLTDAPKTIRLKRPADMNGTPKVSPLKPPTTHVTIPPPPSRTSQITPAAAPAATSTASEAPAQEPAPAPAEDQGHRKTIKVKRPGASGSGPKITLNKSENDVASPSDGDADLQNLSSYGSQAPVSAPDKCNPGFVVAAVIAIIITLNLIWVLAAQTFGPNSAVGDYARPGGPNVSDPPGVAAVE